MRFQGMKRDTSTAGFTMMELVVTLALMGVLISFAIPAYNGVSEEMQGKRNEANMQTIREAFFHYFYRMHQQKGRIAHFPPPLIMKTKSWMMIGPILLWIQPFLFRLRKTYLQQVSCPKMQTIILLCTRPGMILIR